QDAPLRAVLVALLAMGAHSPFFGPLTSAIRPQHLEKEEVLAGTGLVEAGTYIAILAGTILAGFVDVELAALLVFVTALIGYATSRQVPSAPPLIPEDHRNFESVDNLGRLCRKFQGVGRVPMLLPVFVYWTVGSSVKLVRRTMQQREVFYAILAISFFWTI